MVNRENNMKKSEEFVSMNRLQTKLNYIIDMLEGKKASQERWVGVNEAVTYTGLSASTIRRAIKSNQLASATGTGKHLFQITELERWING